MHSVTSWISCGRCQSPIQMVSLTEAGVEEEVFWIISKRIWECPVHGNIWGEPVNVKMNSV